MKIPTASEIYEKILNDRDDQQRSSTKQAFEENKERDLATAKMIIKGWRRWYFRKNSKDPATIYVRITSILVTGSFIYFHNLQLFQKGKLSDEIRLAPWAADALVIGIAAEKHGELESYTLYRHTPIPREKIKRPSRKKQTDVPDIVRDIAPQKSLLDLLAGDDDSTMPDF